MDSSETEAVLSKNFAGAEDDSVVHSFMRNRDDCGRRVRRRHIHRWVLLTVAGLFGCSLNLLAQTNQRGDLLTLNQSRVMSSREVDLSRLNAHYGFPWLTLGDGRPISLSSGYDWIEPAPVEFLPIEDAEALAKVRTARGSEMDSDYKAVAVKPKLVDYVHGEVGALYGTSVGSKFGREVEAGYIRGEIGNDKYRINVGAFYEHSSAHFPRH